MQQTILGHRWFTAQFRRPGSDRGLAERGYTGGSEDQGKRREGRSWSKVELNGWQV